jgi:hypothetical protein
VRAVELLRKYCDSLEGQSAYLGVWLYHEKSAADATFVVGQVNDFDPNAGPGDWISMKLARSIRIGHLRANYEQTTGVAEIVDTGQVFKRPNDLQAYLDGPLLKELGTAVGECRVRSLGEFKDEPGASEEMPFGCGYQQCRSLVDALVSSVSERLETGAIDQSLRNSARQVIAALSSVSSKLAGLSREYEPDLIGLNETDQDRWPSICVPADVSWVIPGTQFKRVISLLGCAADACAAYAKEHSTEAEDYRVELADKNAKADRAWERANYDVSLERRIERTLERLEYSMDDHLGNASKGQEIETVLRQCVAALRDVADDARAVLCVTGKVTNKTTKEAI